MCRIIKIGKRRRAFTLVEMVVVIGIILVIAALAAAFAPRITDDTNLSRAVDNLEQWLLTAKMRAKRDGLATGIRFIPDPNPNFANVYFQIQYIQQPDPLAGGWLSTTQAAGSTVYSPGPPPVYLNGGILQSASGGSVIFNNVDFSLGNVPSSTQWLVQPGDFLEIKDGGTYSVGGVLPPAPGQPANTLILGSTVQTTYFTNPWPAPPAPPQVWQSSYDQSLSITTPTTNYRILRQPRILIGEEPLTLPNNYAANFNQIPTTTTNGSNVLSGPSGYPEILFSPTGAVVGTNAGQGMLFITVYDQTMNPFDLNRVGIVAVQTRTGFIGAYSVYTAASPFYFAQIARESGM